jgi:hypothetical protein
MITITLTKKELKLIEKALLNQRFGKAEEETCADIYDKIETAKENDKKSKTTYNETNN